jgi:ribosomal subunit interface protein
LHVYLAARHVALGDELRAYVEEHLIEPIRSHSALIVNRVEVQLFAEGPSGGCHVLVEVKGHHDVNVRELQDTIFAAVDVARDRVVRQLIEVNHKILTRRRHPKKLGFARIGRALGWLADNSSQQT